MRNKNAQRRSRRLALHIGKSVLTTRVHRRSLTRSLTATLSLALMASTSVADVTSSGDVSPAFSPATFVDLTGSSVYLGFTNGTVGTLGTVSVTGGGALTAAQIVPGIGGLGTGIVTVNGAGSTINLTGGGVFNGLDIGSWGTGTLTVSGGGQVVCSSPLACPFNGIGNAAGSTGTVVINAGSVTGLGTLTVGEGTLQAGFGTAGANTAADLSITNGGTLSTTGFSSVASNSGQTGTVTGTVTIDGSGSNWNIARDLANGGGQAFLSLAPSNNAIANVTVSNGGSLTVTGARSNPATDSSVPGISMSTAAGATSTMTVTSGGSVRIGGDSGVFNLGGRYNVASAGASATLNITNGGTVAGVGSNGLQFMAIGQNLGTGTVNVSGAGSQLVVAGVGGQNTQGLDGLGGLIQVGRNSNNGGGGDGTLNITGGGSAVISDNGLVAGFMGLQAGLGAGSSGTVNVSGPGSTLLIQSTSGSLSTTPQLSIGGGGGTGVMSVSNGGSVAVQGAGQRNFIVGQGVGSNGTLSVTSGGQINASWFAIGNEGGSGVATLNNATANLDGTFFFNGDAFGAGVRVGRGAGSSGVVNLQSGAAININNTVVNSSVILGGTSAIAGGNGALNLSGGSSITFTGSATGASVSLGGNAGSGVVTMTGGSVVNAGATGTVSVGGTAGSTGVLSVASGSSVLGNVINIGGNSDSAAGGIGTASVTDAGSELRATGANGFIGVGRGGTGSLTIIDGAQASAIVMSVGRSGGNGTLVVNNGQIQLSGQQTTGLFAGAGMGIGTGGGVGSATITNGSVVNISNAGSAGATLTMGGSGAFPSGTGTLNVANSQINITAAPGLASAWIGRDGTATATFTTSSLNLSNGTTADGTVIIAGLPGSVGTLVLNAGSVVNASYVGVGSTQNPAFNAITNPVQNPGGVGRLVLNDSTVNTDVFEIGALGILSGNNGVINATGDVIVGGTIDPGNSAGRIRINCNLISLPGSTLILEIQSDGVGGFLTDVLVIDSLSTFNLSNFNFVFSFLGDTDVNAFASTAFDFDTFLRTGVGADESQGLSNAFALGQTWNDMVDVNRVSFLSSAYDVSGFSVSSDGEVTVTASRIPEPATWLMMLIGVAMLVGVARRRRAMTAGH